MPNKVIYEIKAAFYPEGRDAVVVPDTKVTFEPATKLYQRLVQTIGTSNEALSIGDVASIGLVIIKNVGTTNFVEVGLTSSYTIKLLPGQACAFPPAGTLYAAADTAATDVEITIFPSA